MPSGGAAPGQDVFASGAYWREYYTSVGHENRVAGEFLREVCAPLADRRLEILDAGCGPTALYWSLFLPGSHHHRGFDLSPANIDSSRAQIAAALDGAAPAGLIEAARCAIAGAGLAVAPEALVADKARQFGALEVADLCASWPYAAASFDMVQSCFALECLPDAERFALALAEAVRVLRPGGSLALVNVAHADNWMCDGRRFHTLYLTAAGMREALGAAGFAGIEVREVDSRDVAAREQGYSRIMVSRARRPAGR